MNTTAQSLPGQSTEDNGTSPPTAGARRACDAVGAGSVARNGGVRSGTMFSEELAFVEFALFADVERCDRTVVAHHSRSDFTTYALAV